MIVNCSVKDEAQGIEELIRVLEYYRDHRSNAKVEVNTDTFTDNHLIYVRWTEDR